MDLAKSYPKFYLVLEIGEGINLNASTSYMLISLDFLICGFQHLYILFILWLLSISIWNYLLMHDGELLMWNLTRGICTRGAEDICAGIQ